MESYKQQVEELLAAYQLPQQPANLYSSIQYIVSLGGKRLRPIMVLLAADLYGANRADAGKCALAVELFHNFSLMHDDIMDKADLRRGKATVHKQWNTATAILGGDALLVKTYQLLMELESENRDEIIRLYNETAIGVCEGQQEDMNFEDRADVNLTEYIDMIRKKTAVLMGCALQMGGMCAGVSEEEESRLFRIGEMLGIAFQLKDDYLDCFGTEDFGKVRGGDILEDKKTFLRIKTEELATPEQLKVFEKAVGMEDAEKVRMISDLFRQTGADKACEDEMNRFYSEACEEIEKLNLGKEARQQLLAFGRGLWERMV